MRALSVQELQDILLGETVVANAELFAQLKCLLKTLYRLLRTGYLDLIATRHHTHVGMLVFETKHVLVVHAIERRRIQRVAERYDFFVYHYLIQICCKDTTILRNTQIYWRKFAYSKKKQYLCALFKAQGTK